eukprot:3915095-Amphidinium_carterae.1
MASRRPDLTNDLHMMQMQTGRAIIELPRERGLAPVTSKREHLCICHPNCVIFYDITAPQP